MKSMLGFVVILILYQNVESIDIFLETNAGRIRGVQANDGNYTMYLGIPYARVNASNPFGPAIPEPYFEDVFDAIDDSTACPQYSYAQERVIGTLDCLHIHVHVPASAHSGNLLPVLVNIHGGMFSFGDGGRRQHNTRFLMRHDVIFVSLNYRLGVYGFMCSQIPELPGNEGLKDQLMALRWVNRNIESFGGDVNRITIFGISAGGSSVDAHLIFDKETLFRGVIMNSGTSLMPEIGKNIDPNTPIELALLFGFRARSVPEALAFLSVVDPEAVVEASRNTRIQENLFPCIEREIDGIEPFLLEYPINKDIPKARNTSILIGFASHECINCAFDPAPENTDSIRDFMDLTIAFDFDDQQMDEMVEIMTQFYIGDEGPELDSETRLQLTEYQSDYLFIGPAIRSVAKYIENGAEKVYLYQFSYHGQRNFNQVGSNISFPGGIHSDEQSYLFDMDSSSLNVPNPPSPEDQLMIDRMTTMWTNFVKYEDPTPETTELLPVKWEPVVKNSPQYYLNLDLEFSLGMRRYHDRMAFWELFYDYNRESQRGYKLN